MENVWYVVNSSVEESLIFLCIELFYHSSFLVEILNCCNGSFYFYIVEYNDSFLQYKSFLQEWNKTKEKE